jgi:branched-chain amino acid aminotransferase
VKVWVDGRLSEPGAARVSPFDHGFTVGDGVFETCKVVEGQAFALSRHLVRLAGSAEGLGLPAPDPDLVRAGVAELLAAEPDAGRLRITYTGGPGPLGSDRGDEGNTLVLAVSPGGHWEATTKVVVVPWVRNERSAVVGLKTTAYAENVVALEYAHARGGSEAVFGNSVGALCEGTGSNVFCVLDGELVTPPLASGCLAGITRALVIEWCGAREVDLPLDALRSAEEVFLTSSTRDVQPVHAVDDSVVGAAPGPVTGQVADVFARRSSADLDP